MLNLLMCIVLYVIFILKCIENIWYLRIKKNGSIFNIKWVYL